MRSPGYAESRAISLSLGGVGSARARRIALALADRLGATPASWPRLTLQVVATPCDAATIASALASLNVRLPSLRVVVDDIAAFPSPVDHDRLSLHCIAACSPALLSLRQELGRALRARGLVVRSDADDEWVPRIPLLSGHFPPSDMPGLLAELREATSSCAFSARSIELSRKSRDGRRVLESRWKLVR